MKARHLGFFERASMFALMLTLAQPLSAQTRKAISSAEACQTCAVELTHLFTFGGGGEDEIAGPPRTMARDSRGRYLVATENTRGEIRAYDENGTFDRVIGGYGAGPGEFNRVTELLVTAGDSVLVFDDLNARISILSPEWTFVRSIPFPYRVQSAVQMPSQSLLANARISTSELLGLPLHVITAAGERSRSFGSETSFYRADAPAIDRRTLANWGTARVWAAYETQYVIEGWSFEGELETVLVRDAEWFRPYLRAAEASPDQPPSPFLAGINSDGAGHIWTAVIVADRNFRDALAREPQGAEGQQYYDIVGGFEDYFDTIIEIIDPEEGLVISRVRLAAPFVGWLGPEELATYREPDAVPAIDIWHVRVDTLSTQRR